jgi:hypothetical protein
VKDPAYNILTAYYNALNGQISYNGVAIPIYMDDNSVVVPDQFVRIGDINVTTDLKNNQRFITSAAVILEIVTIQTARQDKMAVDNISNQVLNLLNPSPGISILTDSSFQIIDMWVDSLGYLQGKLGDRYVIRKLLNISHKIQQL